MKLAYPACFYKEDKGYSVVIPDLPGCVTQGETIVEAIEMANDAALGWLLLSLEDNEEFPEVTNIEDVKLEHKNGFKTMLLLDLGEYSKKYGTKSVKKTLSIPFWMNIKAEKLGINFSKVLQEALFKKIKNV